MSVPVSQVLTSLSSYQACIFDCDGTLLDSMPQHYHAWNKSLSVYHIPFTSHDFYTTAGMPMPSVINHVLSKYHIPSTTLPPNYSTLITTHKRNLLQHARHPPIQSVIQILKHARNTLGLKCGVVTGNYRTDVEPHLKDTGIWEMFDIVVAKENVKKGKPDPEGFLLAAKSLDVKPETCIGFEDADLGLMALKNAGMSAVDVRTLEGYPLPEFYQ